VILPQLLTKVKLEFMKSDFSAKKKDKTQDEIFSHRLILNF